MRSRFAAVQTRFHFIRFYSSLQRLQEFIGLTMQSRYVGDIGDYVKLALLRALSGFMDGCVDPKMRLGVVWWLVPDETHNDDGRHIAYLKKKNWRRYDPTVFDCLEKIVTRGSRNIEQLQTPELLPGCKFFSEKVPLSPKIRQRAEERAQWIKRALTALEQCSLVFLDPDNGLAPVRYSVERKESRKSVSLEEIKLFRAGRSLLVYHHQTRRKGGHRVEINWQSGRLKDAGFGQVDALRARPYSPRVFFLLNGTDIIRTRAALVAKNWEEHIEWLPNLPR